MRFCWIVTRLPNNQKWCFCYNTEGWVGFHGAAKSNLWLSDTTPLPLRLIKWDVATCKSYTLVTAWEIKVSIICTFHVVPSIHFYQTCQQKACNPNMSWSALLCYSVALEKLSAWAPASCWRVSNQWHFQEQQARTGKWRVVNNGVDTTTGRFENPQVILKWHKGTLAARLLSQPQRELVPAGPDCRTCRDAYWLTRPSGGRAGWQGHR